MRRLLLALAFAALRSTTAAAQTNPNEEQGLKPYDSWHGGELDSVSLTGGGLTLHIPLASFPQRGDLDLSFFIRYSSKQWWVKPGRVVNGHTGIPTWQPQQNTGAQIVSSVDWWMENSYAATDSPPTWSKSVASPDGNVHQLGNSAVTGFLTYPLRSLDSTGLAYTNAQTLIMPNGTRYSYPPNLGDTTNSNSPNGYRSGVQASTITDANGNQISINSSGWTDTMGRFLPGSSTIFMYSGVRPGMSTSDLSSCPSGTSSALVWNVPGPANVNSGVRTFKFCYTGVSLSTQFNPGTTPTDYTGSQTLLTAVVLPDLTLWTFSYDGYADITRVGFPAGGSISYTYVQGPLNCSSGTTASMWVASRTVDANDGTGGHTWTYSYSTPPNTLYSASGTATVTDPAGNQAIHTFAVAASGATCSGVETQAQYYQGNSFSGTLLKTVQTQYAGNLSFDLQSNALAINTVPTQVTVTWPGGHSSKVVNAYDSATTNGDGNPVIIGSLLQRDEYDFFNTLVRSTANHYLWQDNSTYLTNNFVALPVSATIKDGSGTQIAQSTFAYDQVAVASSGVTQSLVAPPAGGNVRGNLTTSSHWLNTSNTFLNSSAIYYDTGERASSTDPLNHTTNYTYSNTYAGAYVTGTCNALSQCVSGAYDFNTGLLTSFTDLNSNTFTYTYDNMLRLTQGNHPDGGWTKFFYPNPTTVERQRALTSSTHDDYFALFDGLGRTIQTQQATPSGTVLADASPPFPILITPAQITRPIRPTGSPPRNTTASAAW
jgi:hypothetical protein